MVVVRASVVGCVLAGTVAANAGSYPSLRPSTVRALVDALRAQPRTPGKKNTHYNWWDANLLKRVDVQGSRNFGFHMYQVSGDTEAFNLDNNFGQGSQRFTSNGLVTATGKNVLGFLSFQAQIADNRYQDPEAQQVTLNYDKGPVKVSAGDIRGSLTNSNPFASFNRALSGFMTEFEHGPVHLKLVRSEAKGSVRTISINGSNSTGPYYLESGKILSDSLAVQVDGQTMRLSEDYVADLDFGSITFINRVISPTSSIVVSYEAANYGAGKGVIQGGGLTYDFGSFGRLGLTAMEQVDTGLGGTSSYVQRETGYGYVGAQYTLKYLPLPGTTEVRVNGVTQIEGPSTSAGGDYFFVPNAPYIIQFKRLVPVGVPIDFIYLPTPGKNVDGDRKVFGLDYRMGLGKNGYVQYSQATGKLYNDATPMSGMARGLGGEYKMGNLRFSGSVKDVPRNYVSVQSQGFNRNERATSMGLEYNKGRYQYGLKNNNSSISSLTTTSSTGAPTWVVGRATSASAYAQYSDTNGTAWNLNHTRTASIGTNATDNRLDTTSLSTNRTFGKAQASFTTQYQTGRGLLNDGTKQVPGDLKVQTYSVGLRYSPNDAFNIEGRTSLSNIQALDKTSAGNDISLIARYQSAKSPWLLAARVTQSNSGQLSALAGFSSGLGLGYDGNGFAGGTVGSGFVGAGQAKVRQLEIAPTYKASSRMTINTHLVQTDAEGGFSSNSRNNSIGLGLDWDLGQYNAVAFSLDRTNTSYLGQLIGGASDATAITHNTATSFSFSLQGTPKGRYSYNFGLVSLISRGTASTGLTNLGIDAALGYRLTDRQRVSIRYQNTTYSGLYGQAQSYLGGFYSFSLFKGVSLVGSYKLKRVANIGQTAMNGSYRSSGFDLELSCDFAP